MIFASKVMSIADKGKHFGVWCTSHIWACRLSITPFLSIRNPDGQISRPTVVRFEISFINGQVP